MQEGSLNMSNTHTLIQHRDIQNWVSARKGMPGMARMRSSSGELRARLCLSFEKSRTMPDAIPDQDDGMSPCSWNAWLAELDRQQLALRVSNQKKPAFEFVERQELSERLN